MASARPAGIGWVAAYAMLNALIWLPQGLIPLLVTGLPDANTLGLIVFMATGYGAFAFLTAHGVWTLRPWGRRFAWWLAALSMPFGVMSMFGLPPYPPVTNFNIVLQALFLIADVATLMYLERDPVKKLFRPSLSIRGHAS